MRQTTTALLKVALTPRAVPLPVHRDTVLDICVHASRMFAASLLRVLETLGQQYVGLAWCHSFLTTLYLMYYK